MESGSWSSRQASYKIHGRNARARGLAWRIKATWRKGQARARRRGSPGGVVINLLGVTQQGLSVGGGRA